MKLKIPNKNYGVVELFDTVAELMGKADENSKYDCCCINVASNIQEGFYNKYIELILSKDPTETEHGARVDVTMMLVQFGPKVDEALEDDEVEIFDGFIC